MLAILSLYVCLATAPEECRWETPAQEPIAFMACVATGQSLGLAWAHEHPKWTFGRRYRCIIGEPGHDI